MVVVGIMITAIVSLLAIDLVGSSVMKCPRYCTCFVSYGTYMKTVECIGRQLVNVDLAVPQNVEILDVSNNSISVLEDRAFESLGMTQIIELYLRHNSIRSIGLHAFSGLQQLNVIDLTGNHLYHILPWTFHDNPNMKHLILAGNPLGHVAPAGPLLDIPTLETLDIGSCRFAYMSEDIFSLLPDLMYINVSANQLIQFDIGCVKGLHRLRQLDISRNPWPCDDNVKHLEDWLSERSIELIGSTCDNDMSSLVVNPTGKLPVRLEKMISVVEHDAKAEEENIDKYWLSNNEYLTNSPCDCDKPNPNITIIAGNYTDKFFIPQQWVFVIGFQFGIVFTLFGAFLWVTLRYPKRERNNCRSATTQSAATETQPFVCPETPPPSYRELFFTIPS